MRKNYRNILKCDSMKSGNYSDVFPNLMPREEYEQEVLTEEEERIYDIVISSLINLKKGLDNIEGQLENIVEILKSKYSSQEPEHEEHHQS